ncbi:MAG: cytochrome c [Acidobacteria bacterium]|nr:cytochrome c [Acidobacteriota bacterium]MYI75396.1 cytochrome c [Acidobacteriota bacterium]
MQFLLSMALIAAAAPAQDSLRETRVSSPEIVRTEYDMAEVVTPPALPPDALAGWKLFVQRCAICHDPLGQPSYPESFAPVLSRETVSNLGEDRVRNVINVGSVRMPGWQYTLSQEQIGEVIAYLNTVTPE